MKTAKNHTSKTKLRNQFSKTAEPSPRASSKPNKLVEEFNHARWGLFGGIAAITVSSAYMNISGWVLMAATIHQAIPNGVLSGGMELTALFALPYAGFMMRRKSYGKAMLALAVAAIAISTNIYATQNFLHVQTDTLVNGIELSGAELDQLNYQITDAQQEMNSIIEQNGGTIPRDIETIEQSYANLDPDKNPINMMNKDAEIGARMRYEELQSEVEALRAQSAAPTVQANDTARSVIPPQHMRTFVTALELMKATGLYILGNSTLFLGAKARKAYENRKKWAIIKKKDIQPS
ncbi:hypothetical protein [Hyphococcus lacteus]|uniref:Uncharacterized protein n=1 Tax=Hyphococcus lacteus TaxID=3143536 RepID=A0ABV3Z4J2_9PROT